MACTLAYAVCTLIRKGTPEDDGTISTVSLAPDDAQLDALSFEETQDLAFRIAQRLARYQGLVLERSDAGKSYHFATEADVPDTGFCDAS